MIASIFFTLLRPFLIDLGKKGETADSQ